MPAAVTTSPAFSIAALTLKETHLLRLVLDDTLPVVLAPRFQFKITSKLLFNEQHPEVLRVDLQLEATAKAGGPGKTSAKARVLIAVIFHYQGLAELQASGTLPNELVLTAVSIAYSTLRGIFQARLAGTSLSAVVAAVQLGFIAGTLGFALLGDSDTGMPGPNWPGVPQFTPLTSTDSRCQLFGKFSYRAEPIPGNPENIVVTDGWEGTNIVTATIPQ